jgi:hypothetical protein
MIQVILRLSAVIAVLWAITCAGQVIVGQLSSLRDIRDHLYDLAIHTAASMQPTNMRITKAALLMRHRFSSSAS